MPYKDQMTAVTPFMDALRAAEGHARRTGCWVVVLAPNANGLAARIGRLMVGTCPSDACIAGSTVLLPGGGRVTVTSTQAMVQGSDFYLMLLGFDAKLLPADEIAMHQWTQAASGVVTFGGTRGDVVVH